MLDPVFEARCKSLIDAALTGRERKVDKGISEIFAKNAELGWEFPSGQTYYQVYRLLVDEMESIAGIVFENFKRVQAALNINITDTTRDDWKQEIHKYIEKASCELFQHIIELKKNCIYGLPFDIEITYSLEKDKANCIMKYNAETDIYLDTVENNINSVTEPKQYNFYGPISALQTGNNSTFNIVNNLGPDITPKLIDALEYIKSKLSEIKNIAESKKDELENVADDCLVELNSDNPDNGKLYQYFMVLSMTLQCFADTKPACDYLKSVLGLVGINLP